MTTNFVRAAGSVLAVSARDAIHADVEVIGQQHWQRGDRCSRI